MRRNRWILVAVIFMVICVVAAAAEDLPGALPTLSSREIRFSRGDKYPVYSGPGDAYLRGGKGKAAVSTNDWIQVFGQENGWILIQYEIDSSRCRIGYITAQSLPKNADVPDLSFPRQTAYTIAKTSVTDDPLRSGSALADLPAGAEVTMLARLGKDVYIEGKAKNRFRGFVPSDSLSLSPDSRTPIDWDQAEKRRDADLESAEKNRAYDALGMWLRETEGIVSLLDQDGNPLELETDMRMSSGTALETEEKSLAAVDMDLKRLAILAETSRAGFLTSNQGAGISIALQAGEMYFRVGQPLEDDESFEIVIDDIVLAIRGTCGLVQIGEAEQSVLLASGHATMARITEETETEEEIPVAPGKWSLWRSRRMAVSAFPAGIFPKRRSRNSWWKRFGRIRNSWKRFMKKPAGMRSCFSTGISPRPGQRFIWMPIRRLSRRHPHTTMAWITAGSAIPGAATIISTRWSTWKWMMTSLCFC